MVQEVNAGQETSSPTLRAPRCGSRYGMKLPRSALLQLPEASAPGLAVSPLGSQKFAFLFL